MARSVPAAFETRTRSGPRGGRRAALRVGFLDRWLLSRIARGLGDAPVRVVLWDGTEAHAGHTPPIGSIILKDRRTLFAVARDPDFHLGESFMRGTLEVEGDLVAVGEAIDRGTEPRGAWAWWRAKRGAHGLRHSRENVHHHYDLGNDFYRLWLDREMLYTCAYFADPAVGLEEAQVAKMDHVCRKLALRPGERVVEAGCGWGAMALHMARSRGVTVKAYNLSHEQIEHARRRAVAEGLADRVEFVEDDYRRIEGRFDAFVSVGMLEHVGLENYSTLGAVIDRSLCEYGRGLLHFIGRNRPAPLNSWIRRRIFPGAYPPTLAEAVARILEPRSFSVLDVENLRLHYARTLEHWRRRFEAAATQVEGRFGPRFTRAWRIYLAGSEAAFRAGSLQLFQVTFARGETNSIPWRRGGLDVGGAA